MDISVIILTYNSARFIAACLDSLFRQFDTRVEVIVVDNASTDNSVEIIKSEYRHLKVIENKNNSLAPVPALTESVRIMLAGRISREQGGGECRLTDIPDNDPGYDGHAFERTYAAAAKKISI